MNARSCVYVSATRGIHDERWIAALVRQGITPIAIVRDASETDTDFRARVEAAALPDRSPILAGPLDTVASPLLGLPSLVGLSWGFDLHRMNAAQRGRLTALAGLIVDSRATRNLAEAAGVPPQRITDLPWGVDQQLFTPAGPRWDPTTVGLDPDAEIVLSLRALEPLYRVDDIVEAFALLADRRPHAVLVIGNTGSEQSALERRVAELGLDERVRWVGLLSEEQLPDVLRRADAYVSASEVDGTSVTLLQAMACATPCVVSDNAGNAAIFEGPLREALFPVGNVGELARRLDSTFQHLGARSEHLHEWVRSHADWIANGTRLCVALERALD